MLDHTWSQYRLRELFRRVERKAIFEDHAERHMLMFNAFKLLEFTFNGLKRKVTNKHKWADNTD
jgi:hypothetical protein